MKPPPGPMILLTPPARRPPRPAPRTVPGAGRSGGRSAVRAQGFSPTLAALALAAGLAIGGAAVLAPYGGTVGHPTAVDRTSTVVGR